MAADTGSAIGTLPDDVTDEYGRQRTVAASSDRGRRRYCPAGTPTTDDGRNPAGVVMLGRDRTVRGGHGGRPCRRIAGRA
ncbi:hypothetical protein D2E22_0214 [Bifidobacterium castoris]|uniref:Uncharacterized protein n=1 Tax=Bifidobacterium castoris TaxID=2306972 RepID=A0A430FAA2_9BIFI|nr:hypothetical protein D2E22_0214 [Bifidobacterium castoris]